MKRILSVLLSIAMFIACAPFISAKNTNYTYILVHGMGGWGPESSINELSPYWGSVTGNLADYLTTEGYSVKEASVGTFSSAWDRACELYAQLTGTRVDYGEAHSKLNNHNRYGKTYSTALIDNWNSDNKVNLIGHSFGGETIRLLASLMEYGDKDEMQTSNNVSPLFTGGKGGWIYSVTTLASPHNGTTLYNIFNTMPGMIKTALFLVKQLGIICDVTQFSKFYETSLSHISTQSYINGTDNVGFDLSPKGAAVLNEKIETVDCVYYFSYSFSTTHKSGKNYIPNKDTLPILIPMSFAIGTYSDKTLCKENDGLVNVNSAQYPFDECWTDFDENNINPGIWNVMPTLQGHHGTIIGMDGNTDEIHSFYNRLFSQINNT